MMVLEGRELTVAENTPGPAPLATLLLDVVGLVDVPHTIPRSVIAPPPLSEMFPPKVAEIVDTFVEAVVLNVGKLALVRSLELKPVVS